MAMAKSALASISTAALALLLVAADSATVAASRAEFPDGDRRHVDVEVEEGSPPGAPPPDAEPPVLCSRELDAYCPPSTTCCPRYRKKKSSSSSSSPRSQIFDGNEDPWSEKIELKSVVGYSCLVSWSSRVPQGPCCDDDDDDAASSKFGSGCAAGYTCAAPAAAGPSFLRGLKIDDDESSSLARGPHCLRDDSAHDLVDNRGRAIDNEYERTPRYVTCPAFRWGEIDRPHGLAIPFEAASYNNKFNEGRKMAEEEEEGEEKSKTTNKELMMGQLAYFTNMGPLRNPSHDAAPHEEIKLAVVGIHGSGRDAGSYLCAMISSLGGATSSSDPGMLEEKFAIGANGVLARNLRRPPPKHEGGESAGNEVADPAGGNLKPNEMLVIAPWFMAPADGTPSASSSSSSASSLPFLQWVDKAPIAHTFRYGAESIPVPVPEKDTSATISSFKAMDVLLETLCDRAVYPNLERIVVAGHSAGGQFVHRWGLSSDSWCFGDGGSGDNEYVPKTEGDALPSVRLVAANPRSYAYLDDRRYFPASAEAAKTTDLLEEEKGKETKDATTLSPFDDLELRPPTTLERDNCQEYNRYCWGLEDNPDLPAPYIAGNVDSLATKGDNGSNGSDNDNSNLFLRYAFRDVVYLSGQRDTVTLGSQICNEDGYQGPSRRERSERFYAALQVLGEDALQSCRDEEKAAGGREEEGDDGGEDAEGLIVREEGRIDGGFCARHGGDEAWNVHERFVVRDVGHDHALMFQSKEGQVGLFSDSTSP